MEGHRSYNADDNIQILLDSLAEYGAKLRRAGEELYALRGRLVIEMAGALLTPLVGLLAAAASFDLGKMWPPTLVGGLFVILTGAIATQATSDFSQYRLKKQEVQLLYGQLERLAETASQLESHGPQPKNLATKLLFDLRLVEAETILKYSERFKSLYIRRRPTV